MRLRGDAPWGLTGDIRRTTGAGVSSFSPRLGDFDMLLVADQIHDFRRDLNPNPWDPRPAGGSQGSTPDAWFPVAQRWRAEQLQSLFRDLAKRGRRATEQAALAAIRALGQAATRMGDLDTAGFGGDHDPDAAEWDPQAAAAGDSVALFDDGPRGCGMAHGAR